MFKGLVLKAPFFEIGLKQYIYGEDLIALALFADKASAKYDVPVIFDPPLVHLAEIVSKTQNLLVFAQHMDAIEPGRGMGAVLPESLKAVGAHGVILNHAERPLSISTLAATIRRADQLDLATMACADSIGEAAAIAHLNPNIIVAEPSALIGSGKTSDAEYVKASSDAIKGVNPEILILQGAGINSGEDVYNMINAGADASGSSSAIAESPHPEKLISEMLEAAREAWKERTDTEKKRRH